MAFVILSGKQRVDFARNSLTFEGRRPYAGNRRLHIVESSDVKNGTNISFMSVAAGAFLYCPTVPEWYWRARRITHTSRNGFKSLDEIAFTPDNRL